MSRLRHRLLLGSVLVLAFALGTGSGGNGTASAGPAISSSELSQGWALSSAEQVSDGGATISEVGYATPGWHPISLPSTVLAGLVQNRVYTNVYYGVNLEKIPDLTAERWWFRGEFTAPPRVAGRAYWLRFEGISYGARIWLNGTEIDPDAAGSLVVHDYNVTDTIRPGATNAVALLVTPPRHNCKDLSFCTVDWNPEAPDMEAGIWGKTLLETSGPIALRNPYVKTVLPLPSTRSADLTVYADAINATNGPVSGVVSGTIEKPGRPAISFSRAVVLQANERREIVFDPRSYPELHVSRPALWWPYQFGAPDLYRLTLSAATGTISDTKSIDFGIRQFTDYRKTVNRTSFVGYKINGRKILFRGAAYVWDLLQRWDTKTNTTHMQYLKDMGLNTVRFEGTLGNEELYDLADRMGILTFPGFVCCSAWEDEEDWTGEQRQVAAASLESQMRAMRAHASTMLWAYGSDKPPLPSVLAMYKGIAGRLHWQNPTVDNVATWANRRAGMKMDGPYKWAPPLLWWHTDRAGSAFGSTAEEGTESPPELESLRKFIAPPDLWPIGRVWGYHTGKPGTPYDNIAVFTRALDRRYGKTGGVAPFAWRAQLQNYENTRAFFEAWNANKFKRSFGTIFWMLNNAWPSTQWSLYDYYFKPGGGYFGAKKANAPFHIAYDYARRGVYVVNSTLRAWKGMRARARIYTVPRLAAKYSKGVNLDVAPNASTRVFTIPRVRGLSRTYFIRLQLRDRRGGLVDDNLYWYSTRTDVLRKGSNGFVTHTKRYADFTGLNRLAPDLKLRVAASRSSSGGRESVRIRLGNASRTRIAFFVRAEVTAGEGGDEVLPVNYTANYVTLWPGESTTITATYRTSDLQGLAPYLRVRGNNVPSRLLALPGG